MRILHAFSAALTCALALVSTAAAQAPPYTTIDFPGATATLAWGINNRGDVVGLYSLPDKTNHGFLWSAGRLTSIDFPGATTTDTYGINIQGDIVGDYTIDGVMHGFVLTEGRYVTVDVPGGTLPALAGINNDGEIVGVYNLPDNTTHTALIKGNSVTKYDYPNATVTQGNGINDAGDMVANYNINGVTHGFLSATARLPPSIIPARHLPAPTGSASRAISSDDTAMPPVSRTASSTAEGSTPPWTFPAPPQRESTPSTRSATW